MKIPGEKLVAGLTCSQVLERLSDYLDDQMAAEGRAQIEGHLRGCEGCARFGGSFSATVRALREHLEKADHLPPGFGAKLLEAIEADDGNRDPPDDPP